jgi:hypothetical protein
MLASAGCSRVTTFFIPGLSEHGRALEDAYGEMRRQIELDMGRRPSARRIQKLWTRRGSSDCITEVGELDPLRGGTVLAIFDMGPHEAFVIWREPDVGMRDGHREVLDSRAYSVVEFDS